jgi:glycerate kinase
MWQDGAVAADSLNILICPDKFKGTLTAHKASEAIANGWRNVRRQDRLTLLPISDGGDGFGEVLSGLCRAVPRYADTIDAARRPVRAVWWWDSATRTAIIESAQSIGLALLPHKKYHPFQLDTFGLGAILQSAVEAGATSFIIGIGGSATNDGGFGLARSMGWSFVSRSGGELQRWIDLPQLDRVVPPKQRFDFEEFVVAVDVQNPLVGPQGASRVFGPQKGLRPEDMDLAEKCLGRLAEVALQDLKMDHANTPGAGAAGGLGFGLMAFMNAHPVPGFAMIAGESHLQERIQSSQLVITGEGAIDSSSMMGKAVGEIAALCRESKVPCLALGGSVQLPNESRRLFQRILGIVPDLCTPTQAQTQPDFWLEKLASDAARIISNKE